MARSSETLAKRIERWCHYGGQIAWHAAVHAMPGHAPRARCTLQESACAKNPAVRGYRHHVLGRDTPPCCREHLLGVLDDVTACLAGTGWTWFVFWGGFLGAARTAELVPWDRDLDLVVVDVPFGELVEALTPLTTHAGRHLRPRGSTTPHLVRVQASRANAIGVDIELWRRCGDVLVAEDPAIEIRPSLERVLPLVDRPLAGRPLPMPRALGLLDDLYGPTWATRGVRVEQRFGRRIVDLSPGAPSAPLVLRTP